MNCEQLTKQVESLDEQSKKDNTTLILLSRSVLNLQKKVDKLEQQSEELCSLLNSLKVNQKQLIFLVDNISTTLK